MKRQRRRNRGPEITGWLKVRTRSSAFMKFHGKLCSHLCGWLTYPAEDKLEDDWTRPKKANRQLEKPWTGRTIFKLKAGGPAAAASSQPDVRILKRRRARTRQTLEKGEELQVLLKRTLESLEDMMAGA